MPTALRHVPTVSEPGPDLVLVELPGRSRGSSGAFTKDRGGWSISPGVMDHDGSCKGIGETEQRSQEETVVTGPRAGVIHTCLQKLTDGESPMNNPESTLQLSAPPTQGLDQHIPEQL